MDAPKMQVKCGVDSCHYWKSNYCTASALEVNTMVSDAHTSDDTCCTTFRPE
jgi:hypothetical protein